MFVHQHMRRAGVLALTVAAIAGALPTVTASAAPAAAAADTTAPQVVDVQLSRARVAVAGLNLVPVTVRVRLTDDTGVRPSWSVNHGRRTPLISLSRVSAPHFPESADLHLTSGTATDGVWSATVHVPSTWHGTWQVTEVQAYDLANNRLDVDPSTGGSAPKLEVTGVHQPALTMSFSPNPVVGDGPVTVRGRAYYKDTGAPIARRRIFLGDDNVCAEGRNTANIVTDARGYYSRRYPKGNAGAIFCVGILKPSAVADASSYIVARSNFPRVKYKVAAAAARTSVRAGRNVAVTGSVSPAAQPLRAKLQRIVGRTWRTVGDAPVRSSGRFTLTATPPTVGTHTYRVHMPGDGDRRVGGQSKVFRIRAY